MSAFTIAMLLGQAACAVAGLHALLRRVFPALRGTAEPALVTDVWGPLIIAGPMLFLALQVDMTVRGIGWVPMGGPICAGLLAVGAAFAAAGKGETNQRAAASSRRLNAQGSSAARTRRLADDTAVGVSDTRVAGAPAFLIWAIAGAVLLLLGAAYELSIWVGQCIFAAAIVLLWFNSPPDGRSQKSEVRSQNGSHEITKSPDDPITTGRGWMLFVAIVCALGQGIFGVFASLEAAAIVSGLMMGYVAAAGAGAAVIAGPVIAIRLGGWTAAIGGLLGVGLISLMALVPQALRIMVGERGPADVYIAHSFGAYALEAMLLLALPGIAMSFGRIGSRPRRLLGVTIILGVAALAAWRISEF